MDKETQDAFMFDENKSNLRLLGYTSHVKSLHDLECLKSQSRKEILCLTDEAVAKVYSTTRLI